jgi:RimJ/RimL family protein N-acetyltransferase
MGDDEVTLRPVREEDLDLLQRFDTDPSALGEFEWFGFTDANVRRRRWEQDGLLGADSSLLGVALPDGTFAGIVTWRAVSGAGTPDGSCVEIGIALFPEYRGSGRGTVAQRQLLGYLFEHTPVHRIQAATEVDNSAERHALEHVGFRGEGVMREAVFRRGVWRDLVIYSCLREDRWTIDSADFDASF